MPLVFFAKDIEKEHDFSLTIITKKKKRKTENNEDANVITLQHYLTTLPNISITAYTVRVEKNSLIYT